ncbi:glycosyl transferase-like protein [Leptomonas pyrrhocoris]|uniref:Glycosyl transferase-like protein n=1 Tax=Leptomonas pyrrhocoris TaxID=157538 RepID=A0A0M9G398_LEPPY|nr:glycosyl transferase-like protein [Leptomonas pyrrhocoris]KPA81347.1 glycosyl transferase-like protein [Leptomonas pyrrhocoris]|eukprot:XP_015659786.1 glycosyl transferase-like protein [Leptomonas pyrrhocoris]
MRPSLCRLGPAVEPFSLKGVFVINLDRRPDRLVSISQVCTRAGLAPDLLTRVAAVDGSLVDVDACYDCGFVSRLGLMRLREPNTHHIWGMDLNRGALGCALSHIQLWSYIASLSKVGNIPASSLRCSSSPASTTPQEGYLILEDDAELVESENNSASSFLEELRRRMERVPSNWELVYVGGLDTAGQCNSARVAQGVAHVPQYHRTTSAYLLSPQGARRLLATCVPLTFQLDTMMTMKVGLPAGPQSAPGAVPYVLDPVSYTLQPPLMRQSAHLGTDIQQGVQ